MKYFRKFKFFLILSVRYPIMGNRNWNEIPTSDIKLKGKSLNRFHYFCSPTSKWLWNMCVTNLLEMNVIYLSNQELYFITALIEWTNRPFNNLYPSVWWHPITKLDLIANPCITSNREIYEKKKKCLNLITKAFSQFLTIISINLVDIEAREAAKSGWEVRTHIHSVGRKYQFASTYKCHNQLKISIKEQLIWSH